VILPLKFCPNFEAVFIFYADGGSNLKSSWHLDAVIFCLMTVSGQEVSLVSEWYLMRDDI
jgi:hypothetical protein